MAADLISKWHTGCGIDVVGVVDTDMIVDGGNAFL